MNPKEADELLEGGTYEQIHRDLSENAPGFVEPTEEGPRIEVGPGSEIYDTAQETYNEIDRQLEGSDSRNEAMSQSGQMVGVMIGAALERAGEHVAEHYQREMMRTTYNGEEVASKPVRPKDNPLTQDFDTKKPVEFARYVFEDIERAAEGANPVIGNLDEEDIVGDLNFTSSVIQGLEKYSSVEMN